MLREQPILDQGNDEAAFDPRPGHGRDEGSSLGGDAERRPTEGR
jgi:hypothetical protein